MNGCEPGVVADITITAELRTIGQCYPYRCLILRLAGARAVKDPVRKGTSVTPLNACKSVSIDVAGQVSQVCEATLAGTDREVSQVRSSRVVHHHVTAGRCS